MILIARLTACWAVHLTNCLPKWRTYKTVWDGRTGCETTGSNFQKSCQHKVIPFQQVTHVLSIDKGWLVALRCAVCGLMVVITHLCDVTATHYVVMLLRHWRHTNSNQYFTSKKTPKKPNNKYLCVSLSLCLSLSLSLSHALTHARALTHTHTHWKLCTTHVLCIY